jgi:hypothetical protein
MPETDGLTTAIFMILMIILGDIGEKLGVVDGQIAIREYLNMTLMVDQSG